MIGEALWRRVSERIDAFSLRERALIFLASAVLLVGLMSSLYIEPQFAVEKRLAHGIAERQGEMRKLQDQMQVLARAREQDPDRENRARVEAMRVELRQLNDALAEREKGFTSPEQIGRVVEEMLSRNRRLTLVDMKTLPLTDQKGAPLSEDKPQPAALAGTKVQSSQPPIYRHGLEITVSGSYLDLLSYLTDLEKLPTRMYWGKLELSAVEYPHTTLKLTVYTLSLNPAWMVV